MLSFISVVLVVVSLYSNRTVTEIGPQSQCLSEYSSGILGHHTWYKLKKTSLIKFKNLCVCACMCAHICHAVHMEVRGHLVEVFSSSSMWVLGIRLRLSVLAERALANSATL